MMTMSILFDTDFMFLSKSLEGLLRIIFLKGTHRVKVVSDFAKILWFLF